MATEIRNLTQSSDAALQRGLIPDVLSGDREAAYVLWSTVHGQNAAEVARSLGIPESTVRSWASRDGWRARVDQERIEQSQRVRSVVDAALLRVIPDVIDRLHRIAMGQGDIKPVLTKDGTIVEVEQPIPPAASVNAAKELLALYNGPKTHHHHHTADVPAPTSPTPTPVPSTHPDPFDPHTILTREQALAMTPDERRQWEQAHRSRS